MVNSTQQWVGTIKSGSRQRQTIPVPSEELDIVHQRPFQLEQQLIFLHTVILESTTKRARREVTNLIGIVEMSRRKSGRVVSESTMSGYRRRFHPATSADLNGECLNCRRFRFPCEKTALKNPVDLAKPDELMRPLLILVRYLMALNGISSIFIGRRCRMNDIPRKELECVVGSLMESCIQDDHRGLHPAG